MDKFSISFIVLINLNFIVLHDVQRYYNIRKAPEFYREYLIKYNKTYEPQEYQKRFRNFVRTLETINRINSNPAAKIVGPNKFADFSEAEYNEQTTPKMDRELKRTMEDDDIRNLDELFVTM